jgi:hypothetical protein
MIKQVERDYELFLVSGNRAVATRLEPEDKSLIGLWNWSHSRTEEIFITFEGGLVVKASTIEAIRELTPSPELNSQSLEAIKEKPEHDWPEDDGLGDTY